MLPTGYSLFWWWHATPVHNSTRIVVPRVFRTSPCTAIWADPFPRRQPGLLGGADAVYSSIAYSSAVRCRYFFTSCPKGVVPKALLLVILLNKYRMNTWKIIRRLHESSRSVRFTPGFEPS